MKFVSPVLLAVLTIVGIRGALLGGFSHIPSAEENLEVKQAAHRAIKMMDAIKSERSPSNSQPLELRSIVDAWSRVTSGVEYDIEMKVVIDGKVETCRLLIYQGLAVSNGGSWSLKTKSDTDPCSTFVQEEPKRSKRPILLGGESEVGANDEYVQRAAQFALEHINSMSNSLYMQVLMRISHVTRQVINGYRYRFELMTTATSCRNNAQNKHKTISECPAVDGGKLQKCDVSVIDVRGKLTVESFKCTPAKEEAVIGGGNHDYKPHVEVRSILGGDDHDYKPHGIGKNILGGDDHDYKPHGVVKTILGGDDHDYKPHGKVENILGGDDHDYKPHVNKAETTLGKGLEDYLPKPPYFHMAKKVESQQLTANKNVFNDKLQYVKHMKIGRDDQENNRQRRNICQEHVPAFEKFKTEQSKIYGSFDEETKRFQIFCENMEKIKRYQKNDRGTAVYGATKFADISEEEFKHNFLGFRPEFAGRTSWPAAGIPDISIPDSWDWRDHAAVTPVKNQGYCGSCWAFSTTGNIEGQYAVHSAKHKLFSLSEQELVDCDKVDEGCNGGLPSQAYEAIMKIGGIETESDYKYDGHGEKCKFDKSQVVVQLKGAVNISQDEGEIAQWLYKNGPISIGINAFAMQFYMGGIAHPWKIFCSPSDLDHGVLIVGYGSENGEPYWIVKNSWGPDWGREGYYYVYRGDGTCGLNTMCTSAVVKTN